jgi:glycosyltransferase involved in cell wall biosynthesis
MFKDLNPREEAIKSFYRDVLGREADEVGLKHHLNSPYPLELVYIYITLSQEALQRKEKFEEEQRILLEDKTLPITLAMMAKDNEDCIGDAIKSVLPVVKEVVVLDTGSTDNTVRVAESLGARVYKSGFSDFGSIRTLAAHLSKEKFIFMLDTDERILEEDLSKFSTILSMMEKDTIDIVGFPRKRWTDLSMVKEVHPGLNDFQYRLFRNKPEIKYVRRIHEVITGSDKRMESIDFPCIHHFQDSFKSGSRMSDRNAFYKKLFDLDIADGVKHDDSTAIHSVDEGK